jgi:lauroyl/myristoyl acyltransferase
MSEAPARLTLSIRFQAALVRALALVLRALPRRAVAGAGSLAGALFGRISSRRFGIALDNLEKALVGGSPGASSATSAAQPSR